MNVDVMTPDELRRCLRDVMRENEVLKSRLGPRPSAFARAVESALDGLNPDEKALLKDVFDIIRPETNP